MSTLTSRRGSKVLDILEQSRHFTKRERERERERERGLREREREREREGKRERGMK